MCRKIRKMQEAGPSSEEENPLHLPIRHIMRFVVRCHKNFIQGITETEYSQEEFPLPDALKDLIKNSVIQLEDRYFLRVYLSILETPNPSDKFIEALMNSFTRVSDNMTDVNFVEWTVMCCLVSIVLYNKGFKTAPNIAMTTVREVCTVNERQNAFRIFGYNV